MVEQLDEFKSGPHSSSVVAMKVKLLNICDSFRKLRSPAGKYRAMTVDKYEYCRRVWKICIAREDLEPIAADCPEFIAAIQFNRRLQFSRLLHLLGQWDQAEVLRVKYPTANSDKIALRRKNARRSHTR